MNTKAAGFAIFAAFLSGASADSIAINNYNHSSNSTNPWTFEGTFADGDGTGFLFGCNLSPVVGGVSGVGCNGIWQDTQPVGIGGGYILNVTKCNSPACMPEIEITSLDNQYGPSCCTPTEGVNFVGQPTPNLFICVLGPC